MIEKKYCKNCKYGGNDWSSVCKFPIVTGVNKYIGKYEFHYKLKRERNTLGDCKLYKRIWWKFWISK